MSRSQAITKAIARLNERYSLTEVAEEHGAVLTLRRTDVLAITTAGTTITWQSALRNFQFTWAGANVTIPADGWYAIDLNLTFNINLNNARIFFIVNTVVVKAYNLLGDVDVSSSAVTMMRYLRTGDVVQIQVVPSANCTINAVAEGLNGESPILHIVQLSGGVN